MDDVKLFFVFGCWMLMIDCIVAYVFYRFPWLKAVIFPQGIAQTDRFSLSDWMGFVGILIAGIPGLLAFYWIAYRFAMWFLAEGAIFRLWALVGEINRLIWPYGALLAVALGCIVAIPAHFQRQRLNAEISVGCERLERAIRNRIVGATASIPNRQPRSVGTGAL
jgi:hypothetical protein